MSPSKLQSRVDEPGKAEAAEPAPVHERVTRLERGLVRRMAGVIAELRLRVAQLQQLGDGREGDEYVRRLQAAHAAVERVHEIVEAWGDGDG